MNTPLPSLNEPSSTDEARPPESMAADAPDSAGRTKAARRVAFFILSALYLIAISALPAGAAATLALLAQRGGARFLAIAIAPVVYVLGFGVVAGLLSRFHQHAIVRGKFRRDVGDPIYFHRRLYGLCWTTVTYTVFVYAAWLALPYTKRLLFRMFGMPGPLAFTSYPDTWVRDLPLLHLGRGAYLSNKATLGTNMCLAGNTIVIEPITIGADAIVGHLAVLAPGGRIDDHAEIGAAAVIGLGVRVGKHAGIGPLVVLDHGSRVGDGTRIGNRSYIGVGASIGPDISIPPASIIPARTRLRTQADVDRFLARPVQT